jgi:2-phosphosulfolactate phosphatase
MKHWDVEGKTVIAIDVLRATSTMVSLLGHGAEGIVPVETIEEALQIATRQDLLAGERSCVKIPGFALGNSPVEFSAQEVRGKKIVFTTTNGTRAIQSATDASFLLAGAIVNAKACAKAVISLRRDLILLCAGTQERFALEDGVCAGLIISEIRAISDQTLHLSDFSMAMEQAYEGCSHRLEDTLLSCEGGIRLAALGLKDDVQFCSQKNTLDIVPILRDGMMLPLE